MSDEIEFMTRAEVEAMVKLKRSAIARLVARIEQLQREIDAAKAEQADIERATDTTPAPHTEGKP